MGGRTGRGEQVRSSPCIKLKAWVLLQLSCLTTALDRCESRNGAIIVCASSRLRKHKGFARIATAGSCASPQTRGPGPALALAGASVALAPRGPPAFPRGQSGVCPGPPGAPPVPRAPSQLLLSSASLGTFPVVTAPALEGLPEPERARRRSPPPPDIDSPGSSRS